MMDLWLNLVGYMYARELVQCSNLWFSLNYAYILSRTVGKSCMGLGPVFLFELVQCHGSAAWDSCHVFCK
jgi:hypothetical protein